MAFTLWSLTLVIWVLVSILCATAAIFAFMQPFWVVNHGARKSFGLYGFCVHNEAALESSPWLDPLTGSIVDVIVVDGGGFEVLNNNDVQSTANSNLTDIFFANVTGLTGNSSSGGLLIQPQPAAFASTSTTTQMNFLSSVTSCGELFGSYFHFQELFTGNPVWKSVGFVFGVATALLCLAAIVSVVVMFLNEFDLNVRRLCRIAGLIQLSALGLFILSIATFPAIMTSSTASTFCPQQTISIDFPPPVFASTLPPTTTTVDALSFLSELNSRSVPTSPQQQLSAENNQCHFGWAFVLASMNTLVVFFLPILSHFVVTEPDILGDLKVTHL